MATSDATRLAVLIDAENTAARLASEMFARIAALGTPTVKRAYGDWSKPNLAGWKPELRCHAIRPIQQFAYTCGKNATDSALIIDAMDLLYAGNVEGFVIVSSDSDFTPLVTRLRESGTTVLGLGESKAPAPLVASYDKFIRLDVPRDLESSPPQLDRILSRAISSTAQKDGWSSLSSVGSYLARSNATFDARDYKHAGLGELVRAESYVDVKEISRPAGSVDLWVRLKPAASRTNGRRTAPR